MFFDIRAAKLLAPGQHVNVEGCPGLKLEASASRKSWTYRYKSPLTGQMKQAKIGQWPDMPPQQAVAAWDAMRQQRADGIDLKAAKRERLEAARAAALAKVYTVRTLVKEYIDGHVETSRKEEGAQAARRRLERLLDEEPNFADSEPVAVTRAVCYDILDARKATPTATQKLRSELGSAWDRALDAGRLPEGTPNHWSKVMQGKLKSKGKIIGGQHVGRQRRTLHEQEIATLFGWLPVAHQTAQDAATMYLWTGARGVEIFGMRPQHITEERDGWWWTVPKAATKNARFEDAVDLRVPLVGRALAVVKRRLKAVGKDGWMFPASDGGPYLQHDFSTFVYDVTTPERKKYLGAKCPVRGWSPHNLRRTARTLLASLGCPEDVGEAVVGHMPKEIVATYNAYSYDRERREWLTKLSRHLDSLMPR